MGPVGTSLSELSTDDDGGDKEVTLTSLPTMQLLVLHEEERIAVLSLSSAVLSSCRSSAETRKLSTNKDGISIGSRSSSSSSSAIHLLAISSFLEQQKHRDGSKYVVF